MPKPKPYSSSNPAPQGEQVKRHREHLRQVRAGGETKTRTTEQILSAARVGTASAAGIRSSMGANPPRKPKSGR